MTQCTTRRALLAAGLPALAAASINTSRKKTRPLPTVGEFVRFTDPTTESTVVRLTNPASASYLPAPGNRFVSIKERFLVFSSSRTGRAAPVYLDLRNGLLRPLAPAIGLAPDSLCLDSTGRSLYLLDEKDLKQVSLAGRRVEVLARGVSAFALGNTSGEMIVVRDGRLEQLTEHGSPLAADVEPWCALRPGGMGCAFARRPSADGLELWYTAIPGASATPPRLLVKGRISNPLWSPDGKSLLFLRQVAANDAVVSEIHEAFPETAVEQRVAPTSQFAAFAMNADGSVFVGASGSKAQPTIILLLRSVQREFTLCEHRASHAASVRPVFSPDSRRVYFQSDRQGQSALYSVNVEALVEPTASTGAFE